MGQQLVTVPRAVMLAVETDWHIDWREQGEDRQSGRVGIVLGHFPRWVGAPRLTLKGDALRTWHALHATARGRTGLWRVPMVDRSAAAPGVFGQVGFAGGALFDDGAGFAAPPQLVCVGGAPAGAVELVLAADAEVPDPQPGQIISHDDWPARVTWVAPEDGGTLRVGVEMPLRVPVADGDLIDMQGTGIFRTRDRGAGRMATGLGGRSEPQVFFEEWLR
jgi:hypothetical protein